MLVFSLLRTPARSLAAPSALPLFVALAGLMTACGSRSGIPDEAPDIGPEGAEIVVDCGRSLQFTAPRQALEVTGTAESEAPIVFQLWEMLQSPMRGMGMGAAFTMNGESSALLVPEQTGLHLLQFTARNSDGNEATCQTTVEAIVGPPRALCPEEPLRTPVGSVVEVIGDGFDDDGVVAYQWDPVTAPEGATPVIVPRTQATTQFESDTAGPHVIRLTVYDADGASDSCLATINVTDRPTAICPESPVTAPTRQATPLVATVTDDGAVVRETWEILEQPPSSSPTLAPPDDRSTRFTPDRVGEYRVRFTAEDADGFTDSCEVRIVATPTPPTLTCPDVVNTRPLTETQIQATFVDDGSLGSARWTITSAPGGSTAQPPSPPSSLTTRFTPDVVGEYNLELQAEDDDGNAVQCTTLVRALATEGLRVEIFWNTSGTDMDTHLLHPQATNWNSDLDCYYANCLGGRLSWPAPGEADDPSLDIDDVNGFGPENINIMSPVNGTYRVGVHSFRGAGQVTVRIYCGGSTTEPREEFGPRSLRRTDLLWRVADVTTTASGDCTITELDSVSPFDRSAEPR